MKAFLALPFIAIVTFAGMSAVSASDLEDQVKVQIQSAELREGMQPGTYVCAAGHLHIKGTVENLASVPVGQVRVAGKVFDAEGKLLGTASASTKEPVLNPNEKAAVNLEFLSVIGPLVKQVERRELSVVAVGAKP
jgi:hypothetical protein